MGFGATFDELLDAVKHLSPEEQADLVVVIQRRLAAEGRQQVVSDVREARLQFDEGRSRPASVEDLVREIES
jgi:hypothetical protein